MVLNKLVEVQENVTADDLIKFANYLNAHFAGRPLFEARTAILGELQSAEQRLERLYQQALLLARQTFENLEDREIYVDGALNILDQVEFAANSRMREVLAFLEERSKLLELLDRTIAGSGLQITLCQEAQLDDLRECSVVSSTYGDQGRCMGAVGIIGPVRMDYAAVVPMVDCIAKTLSNLLKSRFDAPTD